MKFFSPKPKKLLIFEESFKSLKKQTNKPAQSSLYDVFSIFTTVKHKEIYSLLVRYNYLISTEMR